MRSSLFLEVIFVKAVGRLFNWYTQAMDASLLDIRSVGIDILFLAVFTAVLCAAVGYLSGRFLKKKTYGCVFLVMGGAGAACMEYVMRNLTSYVLRLKEIFDNVQYIMSYESNVKSFFAALGLSSEYNDKVAEIVYSMNSAEWKKVETGTGYMSWYMKGIHRSLNRTVRILGYHLGRTGYEQKGHFLVPAVIISLVFAASSVFLIHTGKKALQVFIAVLVFAIMSVLCEVLCFGTIWYLTVSLLVMLLLMYSVNSVKKWFH